MSARRFRHLLTCMAVAAMAGLGPVLEAQAPPATDAPDSLLSAYVRAATTGDWAGVAAMLDSADLDAYRDGFTGSALSPGRLARLFALTSGETVPQLSGQEAFVRLMRGLSRRTPDLLSSSIAGCEYEREAVDNPDTASYTCRREEAAAAAALYPAVQRRAVRFVRGTSGHWRLHFPPYLAGLQHGLTGSRPGPL